jgi:hypothetical protein
MMLSLMACSSNLLGGVGSLKLDPLFAGCLPSKPLALIGARQMAQKTAPCRRVCCARAHETEPSKYDLVVLLALNPIRCTRASPSGYQASTAGTEYGRLPWLALSVLGGHWQTSNTAPEECHSIIEWQD